MACPNYEVYAYDILLVIKTLFKSYEEKVMEIPRGVTDRMIKTSFNCIYWIIREALHANVDSLAMY